MWSWHPELLALPLSLSVPSQGANQSRDGSVRGPGSWVPQFSTLGQGVSGQCLHPAHADLWAKNHSF